MIAKLKKSKAMQVMGRPPNPNRSGTRMTTVEFDEDMRAMIAELRQRLHAESNSFVIRRAIEVLWEIAPMVDPDLGTVVVSDTAGGRPRPVCLYRMLPLQRRGRT